MGQVDWLGVALGALAFFAVGAVWYGVLFGRAWRALSGVRQAPSATILGLTLLCELLIAWMLGHLYARTNPPDHVKMMMATGFALFVMVPAMAINYLYQRKPLGLFLIDGGHFFFGMAAMGGVFVALG
jgi:hypothetical protein